MRRYVDAATLKVLKVKDYEEDLTGMKEELRLEQWANIGVEKSLTSLKEESESLLTSERNTSVTKKEALQRETGQLPQDVDQKKNKRIADLQQFTDMHASEISMLQEEQEKTLIAEYDEGYNLIYLTSYAILDHLQDQGIYKTLEKIKNVDFPVPQYLLDEISDLEIKQKEESNPAPDALEESSATSKGKEAAK